MHPGKQFPIKLFGCDSMKRNCFDPGLIAVGHHAADNRLRVFDQAAHGLVGQVLYLEAEAAGVRGTGIGCYFDDAFHEILGLRDTQLQSLYHFTIGGAIEDTRLRTLLPYAHLNAALDK